MTADARFASHRAHKICAIVDSCALGGSTSLPPISTVLERTRSPSMSAVSSPSVGAIGSERSSPAPMSGRSSPSPGADTPMHFRDMYDAVKSLEPPTFAPAAATPSTGYSNFGGGPGGFLREPMGAYQPSYSTTAPVYQQAASVPTPSLSTAPAPPAASSIPMPSWAVAPGMAAQPSYSVSYDPAQMAQGHFAPQPQMQAAVPLPMQTAVPPQMAMSQPMQFGLSQPASPYTTSYAPNYYGAYPPHPAQFMTTAAQPSSAEVAQLQFQQLLAAYNQPAAPSAVGGGQQGAVGSTADAAQTWPWSTS